ncbi:DUF5313 family protein [Rhodococcus zopfii]|uniref:DUF5313 family protein n=1 Tax=Rhodococcus zopfii TaxID=43772 RepID=UPI00111159DC|nr:DUF5313 family protein [Rhodococcus zopfii]
MRTRPSPVQWTAYALGRPLPASMRDWVRNDLVGDHALARHMIRSQIPFLPVYAVFLLLPGPIWLRLSTAGLGLMLSLFFSVAYMAHNRVRRLEKNGLPGDLENERVTQRRAAEQAAYEKWRSTLTTR